MHCRHFLSALILCVCATTSLLSASSTELEELTFRFEPSFRAQTMIYFVRRPDSKVICAAYTIPAETNETGPHPKEILIKKIEVSTETFERLAEALEAKSFASAAENTPGPGLDGTTWVFRKKTGSRQLEYRFWTPESRPKVESSALAMQLGQQFVAAAGLKNILSGGAKDR